MKEMDKLTIIEILKRWNLWGTDLKTGTPRDRTAKIQQFLTSGKVVSIWGVRRSGKSYVMKQLIKSAAASLQDADRTLLVHLEEPEFEGCTLDGLLKIYAAYRETLKPKDRPLVFLDEVQNVEKWERFARGLQEREEAYVAVSGSSAKLLSRELSTALGGRHLGFEVLPLSFGEFLRFRGIAVEDEKQLALNAEAVRGLFQEFYKFGAFPEVVNSQNEELKLRIMRNYFEDILVKDVIMRHEIRVPDKLRSLARFYLTNVSSMVTYNSISKFTQEPVETVRRHTEFLADSRCLFFVPRFSYSLKEQDNSPRKVYSIDNYLAATAGMGAGEDRGRMLENLVAIELLRRKAEDESIDIYYWKAPSNGEVDFVLTRGSKVYAAIQVSYGVQDPHTREREEKPLLQAMDEFGLDRGTILTFDQSSEINSGKKVIEMVPAWRWLLGK